MVELDNILEGEASEDNIGGVEGDGDGSSGGRNKYKSPAASYLTGKSAKGGL